MLSWKSLTPTDGTGMHQSTLQHCSKMPEAINLTKGKVLFWLTVFGGFSSWLVVPIASGFMMRQGIMDRVCGRGRHSCHDSQEARSEEEEGPKSLERCNPSGLRAPPGAMLLKTVLPSKMPS